MRFEWDEAKRNSNLAKHGIDFQDAQDLFDGRPYFEADSSYTFETRKQRTGYINGRLMTAIWTERNGAIRLISVRRSRDAEERAYRQLHG